MTDEQHLPDDLPTFPTAAPAVFSDPVASAALFTDVLGRLAAVVDVDDESLGLATPCDGFDLAGLRAHTLGWLCFFAEALNDPAGSIERVDADEFALADGQLASDVVRQALVQVRKAIEADVASALVTMSSSRMAGDGVLGMALGEYIIHAWDIATTTGQDYSAPDEAAEPALVFLRGVVAPEYRGPDTGFFDDEVEVPDDATPLAKLLGFAGRHP